MLAEPSFILLLILLAPSLKFLALHARYSFESFLIPEQSLLLAKELFEDNVYLPLQTVWSKVFDYYYRGYDGSPLVSKITLTLKDPQKLMTVAQMIRDFFVMKLKILAMSYFSTHATCAVGRYKIV